jgi:rhodanese-related sulfurtransferase
MTLVAPYLPLPRQPTLIFRKCIPTQRFHASFRSRFAAAQDSTTFRHVMKLPRLAFLGAMLLSQAVHAADAPKVTPQNAAKLVDEGKAVLVDCREPREWAETGVATPAVLLPKSDFDTHQTQWTEFLTRHSDKQILVYCQTGRRSGLIAKKLADKGLKTANVGGLNDWKEAGLPTRKVETPASEPATAAKK